MVDRVAFLPTRISSSNPPKALNTQTAARRGVVQHSPQAVDAQRKCGLKKAGRRSRRLVIGIGRTGRSAWPESAISRMVCGGGARCLLGWPSWCGVSVWDKGAVDACPWALRSGGAKQCYGRCIAICVNSTLRTSRCVARGPTIGWKVSLNRPECLASSRSVPPRRGRRRVSAYRTTPVFLLYIQPIRTAAGALGPGWALSAWWGGPPRPCGSRPGANAWARGGRIARSPRPSNGRRSRNASLLHPSSTGSNGSRMNRTRLAVLGHPRPDSLQCGDLARYTDG